MERTELLLQMLEHLEQYSDEQWEEVLTDRECMELYDILSKTESAFQTKYADAVSDEEIQRRWNEFAANRAMRKHASPAIRLRKIAAIIIVCIVVSGITLAAIRSGIFGKRQPVKTEAVAKGEPVDKVRPVTAGKDTLPAVKWVPATPVLFDNETLGKVMPEIASYYHMKLSWKSRGIQQLRLFFKWDRSNGIEQVVEALNNFQQFHITVSGDTLIVE